MSFGAGRPVVVVGPCAVGYWLQRPGPPECGRRWPLVRRHDGELTDMDLPDVMPPRERRTVDCVLQRRGGPPRIVEFDETQHFNRYRAMTIRRYPRSLRVAFDPTAWLAASDAKQRLEGGGFGKPKPPLFPTDDELHRTRGTTLGLGSGRPLSHRAAGYPRQG